MEQTKLKYEKEINEIVSYFKRTGTEVSEEKKIEMDNALNQGVENGYSIEFQMELIKALFIF